MEVSSHALDQGRVNGIIFNTAIFTNLTHDHLDYHVTMEEYGIAKKKLFLPNTPKNVVLNMDDKFGIQLGLDIHSNSGINSDIWFYSTDKNIYNKVLFDFKHHSVFLHSFIEENNGYNCSILIDNILYTDIFLPVVGLFNISNCLAVISTLLAENMQLNEIVHHIRDLKNVFGRMELISLDKQKFPQIYIDYAHTPDALLKVLHHLHSIISKTNGELWCLFGCAGERDVLKRCVMGKIAQNNSDHIIITSDNSHSESFEQISNMILEGIDVAKNIYTSIQVIEDRREAIKYVLLHATNNDVIIIAGKGHETTITIKDTIYPFSDKECVHDCIKKYLSN
jgi:UDP-N-acetylmuramoyl-L-alanyl-D-glutamate--2,6-diaminopimelate ligase